MDFQDYLREVQDSGEFKGFQLENPDAYLCSAFFIMDYEGGNDKQHLDFYSPKQKKVFSFKIDENMAKEPLDNFNKDAPQKLGTDYDFDLAELEKIISKKMESEGLSTRIQKILLSVQRVNGKDLITGTVFISNLGMLKINIDPVSKKVIDFEKKSFFDMLKFVGKKKD